MTIAYKANAPTVRNGNSYIQFEPKLSVLTSTDEDVDIFYFSDGGMVTVGNDALTSTLSNFFAFVNVAPDKEAVPSKLLQARLIVAYKASVTTLIRLNCKIHQQLLYSYYSYADYSCRLARSRHQEPVL